MLGQHYEIPRANIYSMGNIVLEETEQLFSMSVLSTYSTHNQ